MRQRIDISPSTEMMLTTIKEVMGKDDASLSEINEMCVRTAHDNMLDGNCFREELNLTQRKLNDIFCMVQEILPEI